MCSLSIAAKQHNGLWKNEEQISANNSLTNIKWYDVYGYHVVEEMFLFRLMAVFHLFDCLSRLCVSLFDSTWNVNQAAIGLSFLPPISAALPSHLIGINRLTSNVFPTHEHHLSTYTYVAQKQNCWCDSIQFNSICTQWKWLWKLHCKRTLNSP